MSWRCGSLCSISSQDDVFKVSMRHVLAEPSNVTSAASNVIHLFNFLNPAAAVPSGVLRGSGCREERHALGI
jgi:hypothetical protein